MCLQCRRCGLDPWLGKIPCRGHSNPLQYFCLENPVDRGAWRATVHQVAESDTTEVTDHAGMHKSLHTDKSIFLQNPHFREGGSGWGAHVNPWLIHVNVWQKPLQYCKIISLQLIKINGKKNKKQTSFSLLFLHPSLS